MVKPVPASDNSLKIKFGGGLHSRASADEIDAREAADGANFLLDLDNRELRNRPAFDLVGTLPNAGSVRGGGSLLKSDGTVSTLFQGAGVVYEWDGLTGFTSVGTCNSTAKLRGHWRSHNVTLNDKVLFTDLNQVDVIKEWDGTTFQSTTFTDENGAAFGTFYAKYLTVSNERAIFLNCRDPSTTNPHMIVGSERGTYTQITITNRPSSSLSEADPFFLLTPDLKPVNGAVEAFAAFIISSEKGQLFNLSGSSAKDFAFEPFFPGSAASGTEAVAYIGTDIIYGRQGRIESARDTNAFGNSEADDLTLEIADQTEAVSGWTIVYNSRLNRAYAFPDSESLLYVLNPAFRTSRTLQANALNQFVNQSIGQQVAGKLSPWMKYTTNHALAFQPTFVMPLLDPSDGLEYVFMGDSSGNVYRMEGSGTSGDGGSSQITTTWTTKIFTAPLDADVYDIEGYVKYKKNLAFTITLTFLYAGKAAFDKSISITVPAATASAYWGGSYYWGGGSYWGASFRNRLIRQRFDVTGQASDFQVKISVTSDSNFNINEIGLRFRAASQ